MTFKRLIEFTKLLAITTLLSILILSCGKENNTGGSLSRSTSVTAVGSSSSMINTILNENKCSSGYGRIVVSIPLEMNVPTNQTYVGVTSEGDVAIVTNNNGQPTLQAHICGRTIVGNGEGRLLGNPTIGQSQRCKVNEITAAQIELPASYEGMPSIYLEFRPINYFRGSSLCTY